MGAGYPNYYEQCAKSRVINRYGKNSVVYLNAIQEAAINQVSRGPNKFDRGDKKRGDKDGLRVNRDIRAPQIRVIGDEGEMLGVMSVPEGLRIAEDRGLDLIEIGPTAQPPTCKIMDYGKYKYENKKKAAASRKKQIIVVIKEIQMRPRTDQHDFETKMKHARRFLLEGDKVKINLRFMGREMSHQEQGYEVIKKAIEFVKDLCVVEAQPKTEGKNMFTMIAPDATKIKDYLKINPPKEQKEILPELSQEDLSSTSHTEEHDE